MNVIRLCAPWCASCNAMKEHYERVSYELKDMAHFSSVCVEGEAGVDMSCKYGVRNVPVVLVLNGEECVLKIAGYRNYPDLKEELMDFFKQYGI